MALNTALRVRVGKTFGNGLHVLTCRHVGRSRVGQWLEAPSIPRFTANRHPSSCMHLLSIMGSKDASTPHK